MILSRGIVRSRYLDILACNRGNLYFEICSYDMCVSGRILGCDTGMIAGWSILSCVGAKSLERRARNNWVVRE